MNRLFVLPFAAFLLVLVLPLAAACGGDDDAPLAPITLEQSDHDRISQMARDYLDAIARRDATTALAQLPAGVPEATVKNAMSTWASEGYQLVAIGETTVDRQNVILALSLKDKSGKDLQRTLEFRKDKGEWKLWSPQLKLPA